MRAFSALCLAAVLVCASILADDWDFDEDTEEGRIFVTAQKRWVSSRSRRGDLDRVKFSPEAAAVGYRFKKDTLTGVLAVSSEHGILRGRQGGWTAPQASQRTEERTLGISASGIAEAEDFYLSGTLFLGVSRQKYRTGFDLNAPGSGGYETYSSRGYRNNSFRTAMGIEMGEVYELGDGRSFSAHLGIDYAHLPSERIRRDGSAGEDTLRFSGQNVFEFPVGVGTSAEFGNGEWTMIPSLDLTLVTRAGHIRNANRNYRSGFSAATAQGWKTYGAGAGYLGGRFTAGMTIQKNESFDFGMHYRVEARRSYREHQLDAGVGISF